MNDVLYSSVDNIMLCELMMLLLEMNHPYSSVDNIMLCELMMLLLEMNDVLYSSGDNVLLCELMMFCCDGALPKLCFIVPILFRCGKVFHGECNHNYCFHYF